MKRPRKDAKMLEEVLSQRKASDYKGKSPDFLIIGAMRCGTTSLYDHLVDAEDVYESLKKEIHYFNFLYKKLSFREYKMYFPTKGDITVNSGVTGEASATYLISKQSPRRVARHIPHVKLIVILRDPIDRAISHYRFAVHRAGEGLSLLDALNRELELHKGKKDTFIDANTREGEFRRRSYLARGLYHKQLKHWEKHFSKNQMLILQTKELEEDLLVTINKARSFMGLSPVDKVHDFGIRNKGKEPYTPENAAIELMTDFFYEDSKSLLEDYGIDFLY